MSNNSSISYSYSFLSGIAISKLAGLTNKGDVPLSLSFSISLIINRAFSSLSTNIQSHAKQIDEIIAACAVPSTCAALIGYHVINRATSSIYDIAAIAVPLILLDTPIIQPTIEKLSPMSLISKGAQFLDRFLVVRCAKKIQEFAPSYILSLYAANFLQNNLDELQSAAFGPQMALATIASFAAFDIFSFLKQNFADKKIVSSNPLNSSPKQPEIEPPAAEENSLKEAPPLFTENSPNETVIGLDVSNNFEVPLDSIIHDLEFSEEEDLALGN